MPIANEDVGFRGRGPRNQYIPPITEENLRDNAYSNMKKGGKVVKKKTKKGKATASATAIVNVYTGRRGRTAPVQPRPPKPPQPINVSVQLPTATPAYSFDPRLREPLQSTRLRETYIDQPIRMVQHDSGVPLFNLMPLSESGSPLLGIKDQQHYSINRREPIKIHDYEPYAPIEMKHEKEPDELIVMGRDVQPYTPYQIDTPHYVMTPPEIPEDVAAEAAGGETPALRKRRTKEEMEIVRLAQEEAKRIKQEAKRQQEEAKKRLADLKEEQDADRLFEQIRQLRLEIISRQKQDPNDPHLAQLRRSLDKLTKK